MPADPKDFPPIQILPSEYAALKADKARLDWLEKNGTKVGRLQGYRGAPDSWSWHDSNYTFRSSESLRAAIDEARKNWP